MKIRFLNRYIDEKSNGFSKNQEVSGKPADLKKFIDRGVAVEVEAAADEKAAAKDKAAKDK